MQEGKMNFSSFGTSFPTIQFTTSNIEITPTSTMTTTMQQQSSQIDQEINRYQNTLNMTNFNQSLISTTTVPAKFQNDDGTEQKYNSSTISTQQQYSGISYPATAQETPVEDKRLIATAINYTPTTQAQPQQISQDICTALLQQQNCETKKVIVQNPTWQTLTPNSTVADYLSHLPASTLPLSLHHFLKYSAENIKKETPNVVQTEQTININNLATITIPQHQIQSQVQQIQSQIQQPQLLQETQSQITCQPITTVTVNTNNNSQLAETNQISTISDVTNSLNSKKIKKKKRRKIFKERKPKPKPGEIRLTTALDGSLLYMCPECQVAYPERALLEIHLVGHNLERRFVCDICNAALKRKDHLTRHKQSHNPERPFICTVCLKAFKRKEQLSLHFVIHSGEKRHVCMECGKGFYRKDHLRKHTRSHIARRVKAELSLQNQNNSNNDSSQNINQTISSVQQIISINQ